MVCFSIVIVSKLIPKGVDSVKLVSTKDAVSSDVKDVSPVTTRAYSSVSKELPNEGAKEATKTVTVKPTIKTITPNKTQAKVENTVPVAKAPVAKAPETKKPVVKTPVAKAPVVEVSHPDWGPTAADAKVLADNASYPIYESRIKGAIAERKAKFSITYTGDDIEGDTDKILDTLDFKSTISNVRTDFDSRGLVIFYVLYR